MNLDTPYENLTPDLILDAVEQLAMPCNGVISPLNSYENRVYQIQLENKEFVIAKFYRPARWSNAAIIEEHQFALELNQLEIPVIAPFMINNQTLHEHAGFRFALFPRKGGRALEVDNMEQLEQIGRLIGRIHAVGNCRRFENRIQINVDTYGKTPYQFLLDNQFIPDELKHNYCLTMDKALQLIAAHLQTDCRTLRIHGDCHAGNVLQNQTAMHIVDLDDCLTGPAVQDIWMLLSGSAAETKIQFEHIMDGYEEFHDFNRAELRLIEPLRTLRIIHYAGWLAKRWQDPAFPTNFPWFNTPSYWQNQLHTLREQVEILENSMD